MKHILMSLFSIFLLGVASTPAAGVIRMNCNVLSCGYVLLRSASGITAIVFLLMQSMASTATETCSMSDIRLNSQWDVDNFQSVYGTAGGVCDEVSNNLVITNVSNLTNLNGLANLRRIGGNLEIHNNDSGSASNSSNSLTDITGLRNIEYVGNGFEIIANSMLSDCRPIARLLGYPEGERYASVGSYILVAANAYGCNSVDEIYSYEAVCGGASGCAIGGSSGTSGSDTSGTASTTGTSAGIDTSGTTSSAETCPDSNYTLATDAELDLFEQIGCTRITGTLKVGGGVAVNVSSAAVNTTSATSDVTGLGGLKNLQRVGNLVITHNSALSSLSGLPSDLLVTGTLEIARNDMLTNLEGLGCIDSSNPNVVRIYNNLTLSSCEAVAPAFQSESVSSCTSGATTGSASGGAASTSASTSSSGDSSAVSGSSDLNELCSSPRPTEYNYTQITWDKYCPGYTPTDTSNVTSDTSVSAGSSDGTSSTDFGGGNLVENNAAGCNSVEEILQSVAPPPADPTLQVILESPAESDTYSGIGTLRGWAVAEEGISKVDIYIDGNFFQSAPYGGSRGDVGSIFPEINDSDESGFALAYNFSGLSAGTHTIKVEAVTTQGRVLSRTSQFQVTKFPAQFLPADQSPDLSGASCVINDQTVHILDTLVDGSVYDVSLEWRTADQGFQIQEIR